MAQSCYLCLKQNWSILPSFYKIVVGVDSASKILLEWNGILQCVSKTSIAVD